MKSVGTGEARFTVLRSARNVATYALELAIVAASYVAFAELEVMLPAVNPSGTPLWPPTGLALAALLLRGYRVWPAILLGSLAASVVTAHPFMLAGFLAAAALLPALAAAWLIERWSNGRSTFETPLGVAAFGLVALLPTASISTGLAVAGSVVAGDAGFVDPATSTMWWLADFAGVLIVAPVIVLWATTPLRPFSKWTLL